MTDTPTNPQDIFWSDLKEANVVQRILLFYGPSGVGKTYLAGQLPDVLFLSCDPGLLGGAESAKQFGGKHVKVKSYNHLMQLLPQLERTAGKDYKTVVVDSISYLSQMIMKSILETVNREIPRFEEWNLNATRTRRIINKICDLNCHVVFTAVDGKSKDEVTGKITGGPSLPGKLADELPQACDVVLRLLVQTAYGSSGKLETKYKYRVVPDDTFFAKDRTGLITPLEGISSFDVLKPLFEEKE